MTQAVSEEERLLEFLYAAPVGLVEFDMRGEIAMINPHAMKHLLPLAGGRGATNLFAMLDGYAPELRNTLERFDAAHGTVCEGHRIIIDLDRHHDRDDPKVLACTIVKLDAARAIACISDVTAQVAQERRLKQAETWFASLLNDVKGYAVLSVTSGGVVDSVNASWERQTGSVPSAVISQTLAEIFPPVPAEGGLAMGEQLRIAKRDGWHLEEGWHYRVDGTRYWSQRLLAARMRDDSELIGYTLVLRDVRRQSRDVDDLRRLLTRDHLTGAANRARFQQVLEREQHGWHENGTPLSLIMIDVDHFKRVNDLYGHPIGDDVLRCFAETIAGALRPADLLARLGGEEFAVILPATDLAKAVKMAEHLRALVAKMRVDTPFGKLGITASFGCSTVDNTHELLPAADAALYVAKRRGRDQVHAAGRADMAA
jgi:diguanylate cyclase (GGDEF)-like protein/PAS domain S-box-containing protein